MEVINQAIEIRGLCENPFSNEDEVNETIQIFLESVTHSSKEEVEKAMSILSRTWQSARVFKNLKANIEIEKVLSESEIQDWLNKMSLT